MKALKDIWATATRLLNRPLFRATVTFLPTVPPEPEPEPAIKRVQRPLIMARIGIDGEEQETSPQFLAYGWSKGTFNHLSEPVYTMIRDLLNKPNLEWKVSNNSMDFQGGLSVRTIEVTHVDGYEFYGDPHVAMFFPVAPIPNTNSLFGGPSAGLLQLLQEIAFKLECRIVTIETATDDTVLVIFKAWGTEFSPTAIAEHYNSSLT